ncbi:MAG: glycosyltransferase family 4 protein [Candidatus Omnitrophica bacterium]|nr:glycosyltransferase family 4 protein [Candidatus Omnitrophota bacterium]
MKSRLEKDGILLKIIHGNEEGLEINKQDAGYLGWAIEIKNLHLPLGFLWQPCMRHLKHADLVIVEQASRYLLNYLLMFKRLFSSQKVAFLGHGLTLQKPKGSINNILKKLLIKNVDWWFAYTEDVAKFIIRRGFPAEKITAFQNTVDTRVLMEAKERIAKDSLDELKNKIGLGNGPIGIFCGGMYAEKRIEFLLEACQNIKRDFPGFEMIFLGGGPDSCLVKESSKKNNWIHYIGPCFAEEKVPYFMLADIFLMPGLVGLAVLDSFVFEAPMITTDYPYHSPEIGYIKNGVNGIITRNDIASYVTGVKEAIIDKVRLNKLKNGCRNSVAIYSLENMVDRFADGILRCLNYER